MAKKTEFLRWTRSGLLPYPASEHETFERLVLAPELAARLEAVANGFSHLGDEQRRLGLPWRQGVFLYGISGVGKSAASRALALRLGLPHLAIPAHEILDAHLWERALGAVVAQGPMIVVLEDVDLAFRGMEPASFFGPLDFALQRTEGTLWVATSRHPEDVPKTQLVRPGRFDLSLRLDAPNPALRKELLTRLEPSLAEAGEVLDRIVEDGEGMSFAHFEELRQLVAAARVSGGSGPELWESLRSFAQEQLVAGDRAGGASDEAMTLNERVRNLDPRMLLAAIELTDVLKRTMEKVIAEAVEQGAQHRLEEGAP